MSFEQAEQSQEPVSDEPKRLEGDVTAGGLRTALERVVASGMPVGILHVSSPNRSGAIFIRSGAVKAAIAPASQLQGVPALKQVMAASEGKYRFTGALPKEPIRETLNVDVRALLDWRDPAHPDVLPALSEALAVLSANSAYSSWGVSGELSKAALAPAESGTAKQFTSTASPSADVPATSSTDRFGLQESLREYEESRRQSASGRQSYDLDELRKINTQSGAHLVPGRSGIAPGLSGSESPARDQSITERLRLDELKAIPASGTTGGGIPQQASDGPRVSAERRLSTVYHRTGGHDRAVQSGPQAGLPTGEVPRPITLDHPKPKKLMGMTHGAISVGIGAILLVTAVIATTRLLQENSTSQSYARGLKYLQDGYKELAKKSFDKVLQSDPGNVNALVHRAAASRQLGDPAAALRDYDQAVKLQPQNMEALRGRAQTFFEVKDYPKAVSAAQEALAVKPVDAPSMLIMAAAYLEQGWNEQAVIAASQVIDAKGSTQTDLSKAYCLRGDALFNSKKYAKARDSFSEAIKLDAKDRSIYARRAKLQFKLGNYQEASADATQAIFGDSTSHALYMLRGESFEQLKQFDKAIQDYDKAIGLKPGMVPYAARARTHLAMKNYNRAAADLEEVLKFPRAPAAYREQHAAVQAKIKSLPVAKLNLSELIGSPQRATVLKYEEAVNYGHDLIERGKYSDAIAILRQAVTSKPRDERPRRYLARAYAHAAQGQMAVEQYKHAAALGGQFGRKDWFGYAKAMLHLRQDDQAITALQKALAEDPEFHPARLLLIQTLIHNNNCARAIEMSREGIARSRTAQDKESYEALYKSAEIRLQP